MIHLLGSEAATETVFQNIISVLFFPRGTFLQFSRRVYLFVEHYRLQTLLSHQTDTYFFRHPYSPQTHTNFPGASIFSSNSYQFSRPSKPLFFHQTDIHFPESPI